jgi:hypothetical protein
MSDDNTKGDITALRSRDWLVTVPGDVMSAEQLRESLNGHPTWAWVFQQEEGEETGYPHFQLYVQAESAIAFRTLQKAIGGTPSHWVHVERMRGTSTQARDYCTKGGTRVGGPWHSDRDFNMSHRGIQSGEKQAGDAGPSLSERLHDVIMGGTPPWVARQMPEFVPGWSRLSRVATEWWTDYLANQTVDREVACHYLWGGTRLGKTKATLDHWGRDKVFRVTDYEHPFELYRGQPVVVFDEFEGQLPATVMNNLLEGYAGTAVNIKYSTVVPQWTTVIVISNVAVGTLYPATRPGVRAAFQARFAGHVIHQTTAWNAPGFLNPWETTTPEVLTPTETPTPEAAHPVGTVLPETASTETPASMMTPVPAMLDLPGNAPRLDSAALSAFIGSATFNKMPQFERERYAMLYELTFTATHGR